MYLISQNAKQRHENWAFLEGAFSPEECKQIIEIGSEWNAATISDNHLNEDIRKAEVSWIHWGSDTEWIFKKLSDMTYNVNQQHFQFDLIGFTEGLQLTRYNQPGSQYTWHQDVGAGSKSLRKLSLVVNLSDPADYEGCELEVFMQKANKQLDIPRTQGSVIWFPSYEPHQVSPMISGTRHSLVAWVGGPPLR